MGNDGPPPIGRSWLEIKIQQRNDFEGISYQEYENVQSFLFQAIDLSNKFLNELGIVLPLFL